MTQGRMRATEEEWDLPDLAVRSIVFPFDTQMQIHRILPYLLLSFIHSPPIASTNLFFQKTLSSLFIVASPFLKPFLKTYTFAYLLSEEPDKPKKTLLFNHSDCFRRNPESKAVFFFFFFFLKMKIQCDVCEKAPATVICCADEAALCPKCDIEIHAANKLASKHQRLHLNSLSTKFPRCDICQEKAAFIFCVEDRALLCRDCDESIHVANSRSANHQRFLATGIKVALNSTSCSKEIEKNQSEPSINQQKGNQIPAKNPSQHQQPSSATPLPWAVDDFFHFSDIESTDKKGQLDLGAGEFEWFSDMGFFGDQINQEALPAAEVPELSVSHLGHVHSYKPMKSNVPNKKPRFEIRDDDDEEHFIVPDLG